MMNELKSIPLGIAEVEARGAVPVGARLGVERDAARAKVRGPRMHVLGTIDEQPDVIERALRVATTARMKREVVLATREVDLMLVGTPLDFVPEHFEVETFHHREITHAQRDVPDTTQGWGHAHVVSLARC